MNFFFCRYRVLFDLFGASHRTNTRVKIVIIVIKTICYSDRNVIVFEFELESFINNSRACIVRRVVAYVIFGFGSAFRVVNRDFSIPTAKKKKIIIIIR